MMRLNGMMIPLQKEKTFYKLFKKSRPPHCLLKSMSFFVAPEGIRVKEGFVAERAHQPHA